MNAVAKLIAALNTTFADVDAANAVSAQEWAKGRCEALRAYKDSDEGKALAKKGAWGGIYDELFAIAGGKGWYQVFGHGHSRAVEEYMTKNSAATVEKRNALIAKKLEAAGVTEVLDSTYARTTDGFNGVFRVVTEGGENLVTVTTIFAGGHNIQCLHTRTTVKVR